MTVATELKITVLTLNVWGLVGLSKDRTSRIPAIAEVLSSGKFDIVCLQELWCQDDYNDIAFRVEKVLPYTHYFFSGVTGSGLSILSRYPFESFMFHQWSLNGYIHKIFHGDWFGGKGVGICRINVKGLYINIYTTHLHAQYSEDDDEYLAHRVVQAFDTAQFVDLTSGATHLSVLAGDLNTQPGELCQQIILHTAQLTDSYDKHTAETSVGTYGCKRNSYADSKEVDRNPNGIRIDHILYRTGLSAKVDLLNYSLPLAERVSGENFSYSDHEAVSATFYIVPTQAHSLADHSVVREEGLLSSLQEGIQVIENAIRELQWTQLCYFSISSAIVIGLALLYFFSELPYLYSSSFQVALVLLIPVSIFTLIMATVWNKIEQNGLRSSKMGMQFLAERVSSAGTDVYNASSTSDDRFI